MQITTHFTRQLRQTFSGGLFGVLFLFILPSSVQAFQVDSLQLVQNLDGLAQSILKFADYDSDGDLDLIIAGTNSASVPIVRLYKNNGSASFTEDHNSSITGFNYPGIGWGDVDGDGDLDFAISGNTSTGYQAKLYLNNGSAVFTEAASDPFYDAYWGNMEMGDLDNDGDLDIFQTGLRANSTRVAEIFWNDGKGTFTKDTTNTFTGTADGETPLADVDNDGDLDILLSGYIDAAGNITQVHLNDGTGSFSLSQSLQGVASNGMDFGDYDNDGDVDLILTGIDFGAGARRAYIYENDGSGSFTIDATNTIAPVSYSNAKWGDYDHDGDLDVILSGFGDGGFRETYIYTNNGTGTMSYTSNSAITGSEEGYVDWADLDDDGFLEVAITGWDGSSRMTKIYQNIRTKLNSAPTAPSNLMASADLDSISFSWIASTDSDGGPISYSLYYRSADSSRFVIPTFADTTTGKRAINGLGNTGLNRTHKIAKSAIPYGDFNWGVQAIDGADSYSSFSRTTTSYLPTSPSNLSANRTNLSVDLNWDANTTDSVAYYIIYKEENNSGQIDSIGTTTSTSFTYPNLVFGNTYDFYVTIITRNGYESLKNSSIKVALPWFTEVVSGLPYSGSFAVHWVDIDDDGDLDLSHFGEQEYNSNISGTTSFRVYENEGNDTFTNANIGLNIDQSISPRWINHGGAVWKDYDLDGDLDLAISGYGSQTRTLIYKNNGNNTFSLIYYDFGATARTSDLHWVDFDGDSDYDLVFPYFQNFYLIRNDGNDVFTRIEVDENVDLTGYYEVAHHNLAWGDYDNDGDEDFFSCGYGSGVCYLYDNNGGSYSNSNIVFGNNRGGEGHWGDYDNDGDLDLVSTGSVSQTLYINNGDKTFSSALISQNAGFDTRIDGGDYDNDGDLDLVVFNSNSTKLFENDGTGAFSDTGIQFQSGYGNVSTLMTIKFGDYDADGDLDIYVPGKVYRNNSEQVVNKPTAPVNVSAISVTNNSATLSWLPSTDVENTAFTYETYLYNIDSSRAVLDPVEVNRTTGKRFFTGLGNNIFKTTQNFTGIPGGNYEFGVLAIDNSGNYSSLSKTTFNVSSANTVDSLQLVQNLDGLAQSILKFADYDSDGDLDVIIAGNNSSSVPTVRLYKNDGNASFTEDQNSSITGFSYPGLSWGDVDGDGDLDFAISGNTSTGYQAKLYLNNGSAVFTEAVSDPFYDAYWGNMDMGDLDNDGDLDIFQTGLQANGTRVAEIFWNDGKGTFTKDTTNTFTGTADGETPLADVDNDGDLDILLSGYIDANGNITQIHLNDGTGNFTQSQSLQGVASNGMDFGDYDNDGDVDLILTGIDFGAGSRRAYIYENDGSGSFTIDATNTIASASSSNAKWGDYDHDGDLDLIVSGFSDATIRETFIYTNNGTGTMSYTSNAAITGSEEGYVDWADLDGDGFLEVAITGWDGSSRMTKIYQNTRTKNNSTPTAPSNIQYSTSQGVLTFTWDASTDSDGGPLEYNVVLVNTDSSKVFIPALSDTSNGYRRVAKMGNSGQTRYHILNISNLDKGSYRFGVQAIDGAGKSSAFAFNTEYKKANVSNTTTPSFYNSGYDNPTDIAWVDIDNDGDLDLLDSYYGFGFHVYAYINNGNGALLAPTSSTDRKIYTQTIKDEFVVNVDGSSVEEQLYQSGFTITYGDIDNDNDVDIVTAGRSTSNTSLHIYKNNGSGDYSISSTFGDYHNHASLVDIDLDGDLDILALGYRRQADDAASTLASDVDYTKVFLNDGSGSFTPTVTNIRGLIQSEVLWFDYDEDGDMDVLISGWEPYIDILSIKVQSAVKFYTNDGDGGFVESNLFQNLLPKEYNLWFSRESRSPIIQFDYDGDNDLDLLYINRSGQIQAYQYSGNGAYSQQSALTSTFTGSGYFSIHAVDIDNDGKTDLIASRKNADSDVYLNNGNGTFLLDIEKLPRHGQIAFADYDKDGDLDFAVHGNGASPSEASPFVSDRYMSIIENNSGSQSGTINPPLNLTSKYITANRARLSWNAPTASELYTYNVFFKNKATGEQFAAAASDTSSGFRRIALQANAGVNSFFDINFEDFPSEEFEWGVQAIGSDLRSSTFALNTTDIPVKGVFNNPATHVVSIADTTNEFDRTTYSIYDFYKDSTLTFKTKGLTSGFLFIDGNNNWIYDDGEVKIDSTGGTLIINSGSPVRLRTENSGIDTFTLFVSNSLRSDSVSYNHLAYQSQPSLSGTSDQGGWYLLSNPLQTTLGTLLENIWTQGAINADTETGTPNIYRFNVDSAKYIAITTDLDTTKVLAGEGILTYIFPDDNYNDAVGPVNGGWPKTLSNYGSPFGENITIPVKNVDTDGNGVTSGSEGFKLMGNPYGFPVSIDSLISELIKIDPYANRYVYRWDPVNKQYTLNFTGSVNAYESFFVRTIQSGISGNTSFDFNDAHSSARLKQIQQTHMLELNLIAGDVSTGEYTIKLTEEGENGIDPFDGYYLGSFANTFSNLYSTIGDQPLVVNNLPIGLNEKVEIPLFLHTTEDGEHTLEWKLNALPEEWTVELVNPITGEMLDMKEETTYSFEHKKPQFKQHINQSPNLFGFHTNKEKRKTNASDLLLRINPGLSTNDENDLGIPREVELFQNYPNPFNPSSIIRFGVPEQAPVQLEVFDLLGRKVMTLLDGDLKQPGRYNISVDARSLASGMYIYRLVIGEKVLTKKMTLIK